jgi:hypothetical protein
MLILLVLISGTALAEKTLISGTALAEKTVGYYKQLRTREANDVEWSALRIYLGGVGAGYLVANVLMEQELKRSYYCAPDKGLSGDDYAHLLDGFLVKYPLSDDTPVSLALALTINNAFPCPNKSK